MVPGSEIQISETEYWIVHRGNRFGPFDCEWSVDLHGLQLTYQGCKFGEICSEEELYADLAPFRLPMTVCRVATIAAGTIAVGISQGHQKDIRIASLTAELENHGLDRFSVIDTGR
jgi:hypothetical protein